MRKEQDVVDAVTQALEASGGEPIDFSVLSLAAFYRHEEALLKEYIRAIRRVAENGEQVELALESFDDELTELRSNIKRTTRALNKSTQLRIRNAKQK